MHIKVGEIIRIKREEKGLAMNELAKATGVSPGYLSQLENGKKKNPSLEIIFRISEQLDLDVKELLGIAGKEGSYEMKIPSLIRLAMAKERNSKVLENQEITKKISLLLDKLLDSKYVIENNNLYLLFLEDVYIQAETALKRYIALQMINLMQD